MTTFHYIPLHSAPAGLKFGRFDGEDIYTTKESERLVRLPMYYGLKKSDIKFIVMKIKEFYKYE
jgi:dTDP-4-amino-4,6-dideoxygalactose transaminase